MSLSRKVTGLFKKSNTIEQKIQQSASAITYRLGTEMVYVDRPASFEVSFSTLFLLVTNG